MLEINNRLGKSFGRGLGKSSTSIQKQNGTLRDPTRENTSNGHGDIADGHSTTTIGLQLDAFQNLHISSQPFNASNPACVSVPKSQNSTTSSFSGASRPSSRFGVKIKYKKENFDDEADNDMEELGVFAKTHGYEPSFHETVSGEASVTLKKMPESKRGRQKNQERNHHRFRKKQFVKESGTDGSVNQHYSAGLGGYTNDNQMPYSSNSFVKNKATTDTNQKVSGNKIVLSFRLSFCHISCSFSMHDF